MAGDTMRALVLEKPFTLTEKTVAVPPLRPGYALVRTTAVAVCGSDIHAFNGNSLLLTYPRILGHELCGMVVETASGPDSPLVKKGDKVCVVPYFSCGECYACSLGRENCCSRLQVMGVHVEGGMSEYMALPEKSLIPVDAEMDPVACALIEPLAVGAHAVKRGEVSGRDHVLVLGAGPIGLAAAEFSRIAGARVMLADVSAERAAFVERTFDYEVVDPGDEKRMLDRLGRWTGGIMPNKVIDSTGNKASMSSAVKYLSQAGSLVFVGLQTGTVDVSDPAIHVREATLYASRVAQKSDFSAVIDAVSRGELVPEKQITHRADFASAKEIIPDWIDGGAKVFKAAVTF